MLWKNLAMNNRKQKDMSISAVVTSLLVLMCLVSTAHAAAPSSCQTATPACQNGGTCTASSTSCTCPPRTGGMFCEDIYIPCAPSRCVGGDCYVNVSATEGFGCVCRAGFTGEWCAGTVEDVEVEARTWSRYFTLSTALFIAFVVACLVCVGLGIRRMYRTHVEKREAPHIAAATELMMRRGTRAPQRAAAGVAGASVVALSPVAQASPQALSIGGGTADDSDVDEAA